MTMTTTEKKPRAKKAKPTAADVVAKLKQTSIDMPQPNAPELAFVPLGLIDTADQVRTEFDDETIRELASDIAARGVLQPVLLRRLESGRYLMIAGERRLRASRLAELPAIPAIVGEIDQDAADDMQLAENIQREDLSLADTAAAIRRLFDRVGSLQAVADRVHKSKPWVSKRLAVSHADFHPLPKSLLETGFCEDIETLNTLNQLCAINFNMAYQLANEIREGKAGRQTVRERLELAKQQEIDLNAEHARLAAEREAADKEPRKPAPPPPLHLNTAYWQIENSLNNGDIKQPQHILAKFNAGEQYQIEEALRPHWLEGVRVMAIGAGWREALRQSLRLASLAGEDIAFIEYAAFLEGAQGNDLNLHELVIKLFEEARSL
jgi:ParB/RepB/Spo0J family partition protein